MRPTPPTAAPAAPTTTPARTGRGGAVPTASPEKSRGGFDQLVDRYADVEENTATDASVDTRAKEPRAKDKDDADPAAAPATDPAAAPVAPQTTFPWTLPLNPSWWKLEPTPDGTGDAEAGPSIDASAATAAGAEIGAASAATIEVGIGGTQLAAALSATLTTGAAATTGPSVAGDAKHAGATRFDATLNQQAAGEIDASSPTPVVAAAPPDALAQVGVELGVGVNGTFATDANAVSDASGADGAAHVGAKAAGEAGQAAAAADTLSLTSSLDAIVKAGASAATTTDAATPTVDQIQAAIEAAANTNVNATAQAGADASTVTSLHASAQADVMTGVDQARHQAMQELQQAFARARAAAEAAAHVASNEGQGQANVSVIADGAIATDTAAVANGDSVADVRAASHADVAVTAQAREAGPRAAKTPEHAVDANAWAAAAGAASAEHASGGSSDGNGTTGRGREGHPDNFGSLVSSLRHASDGSAHTLPSAFEARALMAAALNAGVDSHVASADAALTTIVTTAPAEEQAAQIVRSMRLQWRGSVGEAQLRLTPEHLGQVLVSVRVDQGSVTATMHAESPAAQQWIQAHQQQLRDALDAQGLRVARLEVTTDPDDRPRRDPSQEQSHQQQEPHTRARGGQSRRRDADAPRFEIRM